MTLTIRSAEDGGTFPPGRIGRRTAPGHILLHTIQASAAFDELQASGRLVAPVGSTPPGFAEAYAWMIGAMGYRLGTSGSTAIWLWARISKRDLVALCQRAEPGDVLLTSTVELERVLLTNFEDWHCVLNRYPYVPKLEGETSRAFARRTEVGDETFQRRVMTGKLDQLPLAAWTSDVRRELLSSWDGIVDSRRPRAGETWQATVHFLEHTDVVDAVRLVPS